MPSETPEQAERRRAKWRRYSKTPKGMAAKRRAEDTRLERVRGPAGKEWRRRNMLRHRYGMSPDEYSELLKKQGGHCALCLATPDQDRTGQLHIDHDHVTGRVRGLLCHRHNHGLGMLGDSEEGLLLALKYLRGEIHN